MNKEEILERNKKLLRNGDEREILISGKANIIAKGTFTITIMLLISFNISKGLSTDELFGVFFVYCASEALYKYYCLKEKKILITAIILIIFAVWSLVTDRKSVV